MVQKSVFSRSSQKMPDVDPESLLWSVARSRGLAASMDCLDKMTKQGLCSIERDKWSSDREISEILNWASVAAKISPSQLGDSNSRPASLARAWISARLGFDGQCALGAAEQLSGHSGFVDLWEGGQEGSSFPATRLGALWGRLLPDWLAAENRRCDPLESRMAIGESVLAAASASELASSPQWFEKALSLWMESNALRGGAALELWLSEAKKGCRFEKDYAALEKKVRMQSEFFAKRFDPAVGMNQARRFARWARWGQERGFLSGESCKAASWLAVEVAECSAGAPCDAESLVEIEKIVLFFLSSGGSSQAKKARL